MLLWVVTVPWVGVRDEGRGLGVEGVALHTERSRCLANSTCSVSSGIVEVFSKPRSFSFVIKIRKITEV